MGARGGGIGRGRDPALALLVALLLGLGLGAAMFRSSSEAARGSTAFDVRPATGGGESEPEGGPPCDIAPADGEAAISEAIQACPDGSTVRFPPQATYHQGNAISVVGRSDLVIDGNGSTFVNGAANNGAASIYDARPNWQIVEGTSVTVRNMVVVGNLPPGPRGILGGNQYNAGIIVYGGESVWVVDVSVFSVFGEFVVSDPSGFYWGHGARDGQVPTDVHVNRLHGEGAARQCVAATAADGFWLRDSTLRDCYQNGVDLEPDVAGEHIRDAHILWNSISGYYFSGVTVPTAYGPGDVDGVEIRGNTIGASDTCYPSVLLGGVQAGASALRNVVVADNTLETLNEGVRATNVESGSVTGNQVDLKAAPTLCGPPRATPVRLVDAPVEVDANTGDGYGG